MATKLKPHKDRLFPPDQSLREVAARLYTEIKGLPIISPHGHTDPRWFAENTAFANAHELLVAPDHYLLRMLYSHGISMTDLGIAPSLSGKVVTPRAAWRTFARHFYLFRGTPSAMWLNHVFAEVFGIEVCLDGSTADLYFDTINEALEQAEFRPRALFKAFNIEVLATTESPLDQLKHHRSLQSSNWDGRIITTYRPDAVINPDIPSFSKNLSRFGELTGEDVFTWEGYLNAHRRRRRDFAALGATATDHSHASALTANLTPHESDKLFNKILSGNFCSEESTLFQAQMLTEMARMSLDDGLVMQLHPGVYRNHNPRLFEQYGPDKGADIPLRTGYVHELKPLLDLFGNDPRLSLILFTLDESTYSRELAPLAGHYPCLKLGPAWWFHDSPEGMMRFREQATESAGFYNTVGFNDDTRAFFSIPARHDAARRIDAAFLARLVCEHRLDEDEALQVATDLTYHLPKQAYRLDQLDSQDAVIGD